MYYRIIAIISIILCVISISLSIYDVKTGFNNTVLMTRLFWIVEGMFAIIIISLFRNIIRWMK